MRKNLALLLVCMTWLACKESQPVEPSPPPPPPHYVQSIQLSMEDVGVTDAFLRVRFLDTARIRSYKLYRNGQAILSVGQISADTLLLDSLLQPNRAYSYKVYRMRDTTRIDSTRDTTITTSDTTDNSFSFQQVNTFGEGASTSYFRDVAVISESNIWCVGAVYLRDSTGQDVLYNVVRWDGNQWNYLRVPFPVCGPNGNETGAGVSEARAVFAFSANDLWLTEGGSFVHWDGTSFQRICFPRNLLQGAMVKMWGTSASDLFAVGSSGTLVHGGIAGWTKIETGTTINLFDIWGSVDSHSGITTVVAAGSSPSLSGEKKILVIRGREVVDSIQYTEHRRLYSVWFERLPTLFECGDGVFVRRVDDRWREQNGLPAYVTGRIRGSAFNDLFVVGSIELIAHYNGTHWVVFSGGGYVNYYSCSYNAGCFAAVGQTTSQAILFRMRR